MFKLTKLTGMLNGCTFEENKISLEPFGHNWAIGIACVHPLVPSICVASFNYVWILMLCLIFVFPISSPELDFFLFLQFVPLLPDSFMKALFQNIMTLSIVHRF